MENIKTPKELVDYNRNIVVDNAKKIVQEIIKPSSKANIDLINYFSKIIYFQYSKLNRSLISEYKSAREQSNINKHLSSIDRRIEYLGDLLDLDFKNDMYDAVENAYNKIIKYKQNLKNNKSINAISGYRYDLFEQPNFESIDDMFADLNKFDRNVRYAKSLTKSYKHLFDVNILKIPENITKREDVERMNELSITLDLIDTIQNKGFDRKIIEKSLSKIAAFKSPSDFQVALKQIINSDKLNSEKVISLIEKENLNVDIVYNKNNKLAIAIRDFDASKVLGSSEWCISYSLNYYDDYLENISESSSVNNLFKCYENTTLESNTLNKGCHVFYYDFDKDENENLSKIAFTLAANADLVAAFDKNNDPIDSEIVEILGQDILDLIAKDTIEFDKNSDVSSHLFNSSENWGESGELLTAIYLEQRSPVIPVSKIVSILKSSNEYYNLNIKEFEINKMFSDQNKYNDISNLEFLEKMLDIRSYLDKYNNFLEMNHSSDFINSEQSEALIDSRFSEIYEKLDKFEKFLLIKNNTDNLKEILRLDYKDSLVTSNAYRHQLDLDNSKGFTKSPILLDFAIKEFDAQEKSSFNDDIIRSCVFQKKELSSDMKDYFLSMFEGKQININLIFKNIDCISEDMMKKITEKFNDNPESYLSWTIDNKVLEGMVKSDVFLENVSEEGAKEIAKYIDLSDFKIRKTTEFEKGKEMEYPNNMKKLYDIGILDDNIIDNKMDIFSGMAISETDILLEKKGMNLESFIKSGSEKQTSKLKMGL